MLYEVHDGEDIFEPSFRPTPLEGVRSDVSHVREEFGDCLRDDDTGREELESLTLLLARSRSNARITAREGSELIDKVQTKLKTAAEDLQRFDGESFAAANSTGHRADRLTRAAAALTEAKERLREIAEA